jgi:D-xylose transport system ATP-binding protein
MADERQRGGPVTVPQPEDGTPILELRGVDKNFGAIQVLKG